MDKFAAQIFDYIIKERKKIGIIIGILFILSVLMVTFFLKVNADIIELAPKDDPEIEDLVRFTEEKVAGNTLIVAILTDTQFSNPDEIAQDIKDSFESTVYIQQAEPFDNPESLVKFGLISMDSNEIGDTVKYYQALFNVEPKALVDFRFWRNVGVTLYDALETVGSIFEKSGIKKYYRMSESKHLIILNFSMSKPTTNVAFVTEAIQNLKKLSLSLEKKWNVKILFTGSVMSNYESNLQANNDFTKTTIISLIGVIIVLLIGFGDVTRVGILFLTLISGMVISLGMLSIIVGELNIITTFVNAMLLGLGIDYGIHLITRIQEHYNVSGASLESLKVAYVENFKPSFVAMFTTVIAFTSMIFNPSKPIREMGISVSVGITVFFVVTNLVIPILMALKIKKFKRKERETYVRIIDFIRKPRSVIYTAWIITLVLAGMGVYSAINFSYTTAALVSTNSETEQTRKIITEKFGGIDVGGVILASDSIEKLKEDINKLTELGLIKDSLSILSFIENPSDIPEHRSTIYVRLLEITNIPFLEILFKKHNLYDSFVSTVDIIKEINTLEDFYDRLEKEVPTLFYNSKDGKKYFLAYTTPTIDLWINNGFKDFFQKANKFGSFKFYGSAYLFYALMKELIFSIAVVMILVLLTELVVLGFDLKNFKISFLIIFLVILNTLSAFGFGYLFGIKMTFITLILFPIFLGIGVDGMVYLTHSATHGKESLYKTEKAILLSSTTTALSFGSFALAQGQLLREFGIIAFIGLLGTIGVAFFIYLNIIDRPKKEKVKAVENNNDK